MSKPLPDTTTIAAGGRVDLRLDASEAADADRVTYDARWYLGAEREVLGRVRARKGDRWEIAIESSEPLPDWLLKFTEGLLRTLARAAPPWPRRLTRWREER